MFSFSKYRLLGLGLESFRQMLVASMEKPLVVGVMGAGHVLHGFGVTHQLHDLGVQNVAALLPWDSDKSCKNLVKGVADAVFGVLPNVSESFQPQFQRLGIRFEMGC